MSRRNLSALLSACCLATLGCRSIGCASCDPCGGIGTRGWFCSSCHAGEKYRCGSDGYCDPTRGCGPGCDCSTVCSCGQPCCKAGNCNGWDDPCNRLPPRWPLLNKLCGCTGCGDYYFCEWWCDPPACEDPCDCLGNYVGPGSVGYYRAPYRHEYQVSQSAKDAPAKKVAASKPNDAPRKPAEGRTEQAATTAEFLK